MNIRYIFFYLTIGLLLAVLLNIANLLTFKVKGETILYKVKPSSPMHKKYQQRSSAYGIFMAGLALIGIMAIGAVEAREILRDYSPKAAQTLLIGSAVSLLAYSMAIYRLITKGRAAAPKGMRRTPKHPRDNDWLS